MNRRPSIAIVGSGNLGSSLALHLHGAGYRIHEILSRSPATSTRSARLARRVGAVHSSLAHPLLVADLVWFCVPDREIATLARSLAEKARWKNKLAIHSSGALTSDELAPLRRAGASVASVHPLMTFVPSVSPSLRRVPFAIEGNKSAVVAAKRIVAHLNGEAFVIAKKHKVAYHAWGAFASPLMIALLATAEEVARSAGINRRMARKRMLPIIHQTIANYANHGRAGAFSGPLIRGDVATVRQHVKILRKIPEAKQVYSALAQSAVRYLPARKGYDLKRALKGKESPRQRTT